MSATGMSARQSLLALLLLLCPCPSAAPEPWEGIEMSTLGLSTRHWFSVSMTSAHCKQKLL